MRISDWSSDVCSSDLGVDQGAAEIKREGPVGRQSSRRRAMLACRLDITHPDREGGHQVQPEAPEVVGAEDDHHVRFRFGEQRARRPQRIPERMRARQVIHLRRSEEHTSELQSLMRISYAVFCLKNKKVNNEHTHYALVSNTDNYYDI